MKQLLIISGKGGTGKTTVAAAFIELAKAEAYADCDVDAPNLHLVLQQRTPPHSDDYYGLPKAQINTALCSHCGICMENCRFEAISYQDNYQVDPYLCEGCALCQNTCPSGAITMEPSAAGKLKLYVDNKTVFSTAKLNMGSGNSGKLVSEVKNRLKTNVSTQPLTIIDGSPGIGCPVIASMSGVDLALIVTEPSVSGISDLKRLLATARQFGVTTAVCVNKSDINQKLSKEIIDYCQQNDISFVGNIPFDQAAVTAVNMGKSIIAFDGAAAQAIKTINQRTINLLFNTK